MLSALAPGRRSWPYMEARLTAVGGLPFVTLSRRSSRCTWLTGGGRGASTREGPAPYALEREAQDVIAVTEMIDAPVLYLGHSYGAIVGMEALVRTDGIEKALLYEPPFDAGGYVMVPASFRERVSALLQAGQREEALELFYRDVVAIDPTPLRTLPVWQARLAAVHTLET